jgi:hypothetical protein
VRHLRSSSVAAHMTGIRINGAPPACGPAAGSDPAIRWMARDRRASKTPAHT